MAYTDYSGKTILHSWGRFRITLGANAITGDLIARDGTLADANGNRPAFAVVCQDGDSGDDVWAAKKAEVKKASSIGTGGAVTRGNHSGTADDVLWLSATGGKASATPVATIGQVVGTVLSQDTFLLEPAEQYDGNIELVASNKTVDEQDCGKQMYVTADAVVVTLPATSGGLNFVVVNSMNNAGALISVSPNASDLITGPDYAGTDDKDWQNTKATARCGDRIEVVAKTTHGYCVSKLVGTWAQES